MSTVTALTAQRTGSLEDAVIIDADLNNAGELIMTKGDTSVINAGIARGPNGVTGVSGSVAVASLEDVPAGTPAGTAIFLSEPETQATVGFTQIQTLSGANLSAKIATLANGTATSFGTDTYTWDNFGTSQVNGIWGGFVNRKGGMRGMGIGKTIFQQNANTNTHAATIPADGSGGTNQEYLLYTDVDDAEYSRYEVRGTAQQGSYYNGHRSHGQSNCTFKNIKHFDAAPGYKQYPPGETFSHNDYLGSNNHYIDYYIDGNNKGATAFGTNDSDNIKFTRCSGVNCKYSAAFALWQGEGVFWLIDCVSDNNKTAINIERMGERNIGRGGCTIHVVNFNFGNYVLGGQDLFLANDNDSTVVHIYDPIGITTSRKLYVYFPVLEQDNPNVQLKSDLHIWTGGSWSGGLPGVGTYVGGTDHGGASGDLVTWSR